MNLQELPNKELYALCKQYGKNVRKWSREFGFLLPEVARRGMYRQYHCTSIYEFAAKLAGMSRDIAERILSLARKLEDKPHLWDIFKRYGWSKLAVVAGIATGETDEFWADKVKRLPKLALLGYVRAWRKNNLDSYADSAKLSNSLFDSVTFESIKPAKDSLIEPKIGGPLELGYEQLRDEAEQPKGNKKCNYSESGAASLLARCDDSHFKPLKKLKFKVDSETEFEFKKFKQAMEKEKKETLTMGETLKFLLKKVKELENKNITILQTKNARQGGMVSGACHDKPSINPTKPVTRKVSQKRQNLIITFYNGKCAFPECNQPYSELHHPDRFSLKKSHQKIYPLCKTHHQAAHSGLIKNEDQTIEKWEFNLSSGQQPTNQQKKSLKVALPAIPLVTPELSASRLENIFDLYQASQKDYVDSRVRNHWIT